MIKAFILDLDGTLLDSMRIWDNIGSEYLASVGVQDIPADIKEILKPMSLLEAAEYFIAEFSLCKTADQIMDEINKLIEDKYRFEIPLKEGVLAFLHKHKHIRMCIATATDRHLAEAALTRLGILQHFEFIITSTEVGSSKQKPDIFIKAVERLGVAINEAVVFEDALHAIKTVKSAGFYVVGVAEESFEKDKDEIIKGCGLYLKNLSEFEVLE